MRQGRFQKQATDLVQHYSESISFDWRLYAHDIRASQVHARALARAGILREEEATEINSALEAIGEDIAAGKMTFRLELEDIHMHIEAELTERLGELGAKLHTARSRNDQVATDMRLYCRDALDDLGHHLAQFQRTLLTLAESYADALLPGYTHLQRGQPISLAHHLLAYVEMFARDRERLAQARKRLNVLPLGSGALAGSTIVLDREWMASELAFDGITQNSMDAVSDRDFVADILYTLTLLGVHFSRLSEDLILWATSEFGFLQLDDAHTTGSSLMPQKKNPDVAELARGKTGRLLGNLTGLLTTLKGLPMTYNRDLQEDKEPLFDSLDTASLTIAVFTDMLGAAKFHRERMRTAAEDPYLLATDLADFLVTQGVPFRRAHDIMGSLTAHCLESEISFRELRLEQWREFSEAFTEDVFQILSPQRALDARQAPGAPHPEHTAARIAHWKKQLPESS